MAKTTIVGDISIPVGSYTLDDGTVKKRGRNIGTVFKTTEDDGIERLSLKIDAEVFHASLYALASAFRKKGEDSFWLNIFPPRDEQKTKAAAAPQTDENGVPF